MLKKQSKESSGIAFSIFFMMLYLNTLPRTKYEMVWPIGELIINLTLFVVFIYLMKTWIVRGGQPLSLKSIYVAIFLFIAVNTFGYMQSDYVGGFYFLKVLLLWLYILAVASFRGSVQHVKIAGIFTAVISIIFLIYWAYQGFPTSLNTGIFRNENYMAVVLFCMLYFLVLPIKYSRIAMRILYVFLIIGNLIMIGTTGARSVMIGLFIALLAWGVLKKSHRLFHNLFYVILVGNFLFITIYIGLKSTSLGNYLNSISRMIFNKNLFSGRIEVWEQLFHAIAQKPFFGYGIGVEAKFVTDLPLTAHNLYLQILLENGIVGFVIFLLILIATWKLLMRNLNQFVARWSACFMLGILVYENLELTMTQNNLPIAMFQWLIIAFGIGFGHTLDKLEEEEPVEYMKTGEEATTGSSFYSKNSIHPEDDLADTKVFNSPITTTGMSRKSRKNRRRR